MKSTAFAVALTALLSPFATGQSFISTLGASLAAGDDTTHDVTLGFNFPFPDGTTTNAIRIDSNGLISPTSSGLASQPTDSVPDFESGLGSTLVAIAWDDLGQNFPTSDIRFNSTATEATITWCDVSRNSTFNNLYPFTFQAQLYPDGSVVFCYDHRMIAGRWITGLSNGSASPGETDLSGGASTPTTTVYENYETSATQFDIDGGSLTFTPNGSGGYDVTVGGDPGPCVYSLERFGSPCPVSFEFLPNGIGGYLVSRVPTRFFDDGGAGTELAAGSLGDDLNTAAIPIGFTFPFPGGLMVTDVFADNNGRIMTDTTDPGDFSPSVGEMLTSGPAMISAYWTDLSSQRGSLRAFQDAGNTFLALTWEDVPKFSENLTNTFQIVLFNDGRFELNYKDVSMWRTGGQLISDDVLIGCTGGPAAMDVDPGASDLSTAFHDTGDNSNFYEFFDANNFPSVRPDIHTELEPTGDLRLGGALAGDVTGISSNAFAAILLFGFTPLDAPLGPLSIGLDGCSLYVDFVSAIDLVGTPPTISFNFPIDGSPTLIGLPVVCQAVTAPGETDFGFVFTNAIRGVIQP